jgi:ferrous iron transport protein A
MTEQELMNLAGMPSGAKGIIVAVKGGPGLINRLNSLGIRPNKRITKISSMMMRGPVTIDMDGSHIALGFGMARRVIVKPDGPVK